LKLSSFVAHAERVTAITATKLQMLVPPRQQSDAMTCCHTQQRMPHPRQPFRLKQKGMTAMACVLRQPPAFRHLMNSVSEPATTVSDKFAEAFLARVGGGFPLEHQRVTAVAANVFTVACALANLRIQVAAQEARQIMPHVCRRSVSAKQGFSTRTHLLSLRDFCKVVIGEAVAENAASQSAHGKPGRHGGRSCHVREKRRC